MVDTDDSTSGAAHAEVAGASEKNRRRQEKRKSEQKRKREKGSAVTDGMFAKNDQRPSYIK